MPGVDCFTIPGLECWFWSDDHEPPHFHVKRRGEWEIKVQILTGEDLFELQWGTAPKAKVLREIALAVRAHRAELLAEWQAKVNHDA